MGKAAWQVQLAALAWQALGRRQGTRQRGQQRPRSRWLLRLVINGRELDLEMRLEPSGF